MSKRIYEEYIKNDCHPVGYNEPCQSYYFAQSSVDLLLDKIDQLKQQLAEKDIRIAELEKEIAYIKKNAIVPKFKVGQKIWYIDRYGIQKDTIISFTYFSIQNEILYKMGDEIIDYREEYIFVTEQEAQVKLKELRNE